MGKTGRERAVPAASDTALLRPLRVLLALSVLAVGLYYEWGCALSSVLLFGLLLWYGKRKPIRFPRNLTALAVAVTVAAYGVSALWAVDGGLALWGLVKLLPAALFMLACYQLQPDQRRVLLGDLPYLGAVTTVLSFALQWVPAFSDAFSIAGRLGGFFQYPNTFACFLLLGLAVLVFKRSDSRWDILCCAVLSAGLLLARSRTVLVFAVILFAAALILRREKRARLLVGTAVLSGAVIVGLALLLRKGDAAAAISTTTLLGRLVYWKDALGVILRHPFGVGHLGYYLTQGSFQTAVYSVRWVHNALLQVALDVGWIPAGLLCAAVLRAIVSRKTGAVERAALLVLAAHSLMDFDLSFTAMWFVLLLCLDWDGRFVTLKKGGKRALAVFGAVLCALSVWIGAATAFSYAGNADAALKLYPWDTFSAAAQLTEIESAPEMEAAADKLLSRDTALAIAWDAKARSAFSGGDVAVMMEAKRNAISCARYSLEEYTDYFEMLAAAASLYQQAGDDYSVQQCLNEIRSLQTMLDALADETDPLAWRFPEQPELTMPQEYQDYIEAAGL